MTSPIVPGPSRLDELPAALVLQVDALCDDFERHWQRARRRGTTSPAIESFLTRASSAAQPALDQCLRKLEHELRTGLLLPEIPGLILEEELGRGGMGVVYRARRMVDDRDVALKLIPGAEHARWSRWLAELADLHHPNLVPLEAFGTHEGLHFVVMPLVRGGDLKERFSEFVVGPSAGRTALRGVAQLIGKVANAVDFLHRCGILHRDLKPSNILLASPDDCEPLVCDFGLAGRLDEACAESSVVGTPPYMAPEQMAGRPLTGAADIWSLGAVLYELLTGRPPFVRAVMASAKKPQNQLLPPHELNPQIDDMIERICLRCLGVEAADRYATAAELAADLRDYQQDPSEDRSNS